MVFVGFVALLLLSNRPGTTVDGKMVVTSVDQYKTVRDEALQIATGPLQKVELGQTLEPSDVEELRRAAELYEALNHFNPSTIEPFFVLGRVYLELNEVDQALTNLNQAMLNVPEALRKARDDNDEPRARAIQLTLYEIHNQRAQTFLKRGEPEKAVTDAEIACQYVPESPAYRTTLAAALAKVGDLEAAKEELQEALRLDPQYPRAKALDAELKASRS